MDTVFNNFKKDLSPLLPTLLNVKKLSADQYNEMPDEFRAIARRRTQSGYLNDLMLMNLRSALSGRDGVVFYERYGQTTLSYLGKYIIKSKQINNKKEISCIATQAVMEFMENGEYQLSLPGIDSPLNFILGYKWNDLRTEIEKLYLLHPDGIKNFDWEYEITMVENAAPVDTSESSLDKGRVKRVQPKKQRISQKQADQNG